MKKKSGFGVVGVSLVLILFVMAVWCIGNYNGLVGLQESVTSQSSNIDTQLQRRADLIPNLVNTVKGFTSHEAQILSEISNSRAKLAGASSMAEKSDADAELSSALSRLLIVVENYPNLKADVQFKALIDELAGTENRLATARKDYNAAVQSYNHRLKIFPANIMANMFGFTAADYFEASASADQSQLVSFD